MQAIANLIVAAIDLLELEGRALHRGVLRLVWKVLALVGTAVVGLAGLGFVFVALYMLLARLVGWPIATALIGLVMLGGAYGLFLYARSLPMLRKSVVGVDAQSPEERALDDAVARAQADRPAGRTHGYQASGVSGSVPLHAATAGVGSPATPAAQNTAAAAGPIRTTTEGAANAAIIP
ncbi:MAG TPA: hypothetical protein VF624_03900 [Tepidisphaeraceae bacterium]|jgi:hypothetical protein